MKLEIDRLVVHGVSGADSERLVAVIERELRSLVSAAGAPRGSLDLAGRVFEIPAGLGVDDVGRRVARSIWTTCQGQGGAGPPTGPPTAPPGGPPPAANDNAIIPPSPGGERGRD